MISIHPKIDGSLTYRWIWTLLYLKGLKV